MAITATFNLQLFNARNGWLVRDIDVADADTFARYVDYLDRAGDAAPFGVDAALSAAQWSTLLDQLDVTPPRAVVQADVEPIEGAVEAIVDGPGFPEEVVIGSREPDRIDGGRTDDLIQGWARSDVLRGRGGEDVLDGGRGPDRLLGNQGPDLLVGGLHHDRLLGQVGKDVLDGGKGDDILRGGPGADTFLFDGDSFGRRGGGIWQDTIVDFDPQENDQIVDLTGNLRILAVGELPAFEGGSGTLLQNRMTGDQVFIRGARLTEEDVRNEYDVPPDPGPSDEIAPFAIEVERERLIDQGDFRFVTVKVSITNFTDFPVSGIDDLEFVYNDADDVVIPALPTPNPSGGASYRDGVFRLVDLENDLTRPPLQPNETRELFTFTYRIERGEDGDFPDIEAGPEDFEARNFRPFDPNDPGSELTDLEIDVRISEREITEGGGGTVVIPGFENIPGFEFIGTPAPGGGRAGEEVLSATADVFLRNTQDFPIENLEDYEFELTNDDVTVTGRPWGATFDPNERVFDVGAWPNGDSQGRLDPGEEQKVFGFTFTQPVDSSELDSGDFDLGLS